MIEITARLVRDKSAVFLAGEVVECFVTFKNVDKIDSVGSQEPTSSTRFVLILMVSFVLLPLTIN